MHLVRPSTLQEWSDLAAAFLLAQEAEHGLMLGLAARPAPPGSYWSLVMDDTEVVLAALRTRELLLLSREARPGAAALVAADTDPAGVLGPLDVVDAFTLAAGGTWRKGYSQRVHELRRVTPARPVQGRRRVATAPDRDVLTAWFRAFAAEALGQVMTRETAESDVESRIAGRTLHVWDVDGLPVACAAQAGPTPHAIRVNAVYTPPERRGHGYASALVADLSQHLLDAGHDFVFLYTDLANPTSNAIYRRIGYTPVADAQEMWRVRTP